MQVSRVDLEARKIDLVLSGADAAAPSAYSKPRSAAHKALDAKPAKSRKGKPSPDRFEAELEAPARSRRGSNPSTSGKPAPRAKASKTSSKSSKKKR